MRKHCIKVLGIEGGNVLFSSICQCRMDVDEVVVNASSFYSAIVTAVAPVAPRRNHLEPLNAITGNGKVR